MSDSNVNNAEALYKQKLEALIETGKDDKEKAQLKADIPGILSIFRGYIKNKKRVIDWAKIKPPPSDMVVNYNDIPPCPEDRKKTLANKLVVVKLNGGLGTTMGCTGPKSVIEVRNGETFLDLIVQQVQHLNKTLNSNVPLVLMNSFNTDADTAKVIGKYKQNIDIRTFNQSRHPRILKDALVPMASAKLSDDTEWAPSGHGATYESLLSSGMLDKLISEGREYMFLSNVDNLGATVDFNILNMISAGDVEYCMEVTDKTRADVKGGTLIEYEGKAKLLELAQCPADKVEEFKSIKKFKIFNTNNLWINLKAIKRVLDAKQLDEIDIIVNPKTVNGRSIIQLEIAAGAAIEFFKNSRGVNVPRSRFLPVKSCSDLFIIQSNLYTISNGELIMNPARAFPTVPLVKLGDNFKKVSDYMSRFKGSPDIIELDQLTVSGDVSFGPNVSFRGTVIIIATHGARIEIPEGSVFENKVVSGNLRILEH